ncbi:interferon-induced protein with tetratricopeptide repeats 3-like [Ptychodera flava]|uniref:interferon-induced protein with tetratricopeptide repeats 3-like n=1 Tax=Ptychodera flava TaxID=63121 RepID=UPI00396A7CB7
MLYLNYILAWSIKEEVDGSSILYHQHNRRFCLSVLIMEVITKSNKAVYDMFSPGSDMYEDKLIEDFSFTYDEITDGSREAILKTLPCYFNWKLEDFSDEDRQVLVRCAQENLKSNTELSLVAHKTVLGYLNMTQFMLTEDRNPDTALRWYDDALADNRKDIDKYGDNDGPLGDKLVLLSNMAWVFFLLNRFDKVDEILKTIKLEFDGKLSKNQKAFIYAHKGMSLVYYEGEMCDVSIACLNRGLSVFPCRVDWLFWSAYMLEAQPFRFYDDFKDQEFLSMLDQSESLYRNVLEHNSNHCYAKAMLGRVLSYKGQHDEAESLIRDALKLNRTTPTVACCASELYVEDKKFEMSIEVLRQSLEVWPNNTYVLHYLGNTYKSKYLNEQETGADHGDLETAIRYYDEAIKYASGHLPEAILDKAEVCTLMGNTPEAINLLLLGITITRDPYWKSLAYFRSGKFYMDNPNFQPGEHNRRFALNYFQLSIKQGDKYWCAKRAVKEVGCLTVPS